MGASVRDARAESCAVIVDVIIQVAAVSAIGAHDGGSLSLGAAASTDRRGESGR